MFNKLLLNIKTETSLTSYKGSDEMIELVYPTPRAAYVTSAALDVRIKIVDFLVPK
jgi:hypothetical protein